MKKVIHAILAGLLLCAAFAGCSAAGDDATQSALEELSSRLDVLSQRVDELESAQAQQLTPAPEEETSAVEEEPSSTAGEEPAAAAPPPEDQATRTFDTEEILREALRYTDDGSEGR